MPWGGHDNTLDFCKLRADTPWLVEHRRPMVVSPDLDGLLSGALLWGALSWKPVGFYDVSNLWLLPEYERLDAAGVVFVDHDIYRSNFPSIGHHMLVWGPDTMAPAHTDSDAPRLNPNLLRGFCQRDHFTRKYPFGTFHFLLAILSEWQMVELPSTTDDLLLLTFHADSSLQNAFAYPENALDWMRWLGGDAPTSPLEPFCRTVRTVRAQRLLEGRLLAQQKLRDLGFTQGRLQCQSNPEHGDEWEQFLRAATWVENTLEVSGFADALRAVNVNQLLSRSLKRQRCTPNKRNYESVIAAAPFSFAIESQEQDRGLNYGDF